VHEWVLLILIHVGKVNLTMRKPFDKQVTSGKCF
jgi:hypothetical protein